MMIKTVDHVQLSMRADDTDAMRDFYLDVLAMIEVEKPHALKARGGFWVKAGMMNIHFGVDDSFVAQKKPHIALGTDDLDNLAARFEQRNLAVTWDTKIPDIRRFFSVDPAGNRIELMEVRQ